MAAHPFGPITNSLIVGFNRRGGFQPQCVTVRKTQPQVFELPTAALDPMYACATFKNVSVAETNKNALKSQIEIDCVIDSDKLWAFMRNHKFGYQITFILEDPRTEMERIGSEPRVLVEVLHEIDGSVTRSYHIFQQNWDRLVKHEVLNSFLHPFQGSKQVRVRVTRDRVAVWADGELRQQLTTKQRLDHPERTRLFLENILLDTSCSSINFELLGSAENKDFFTKLSKRVFDLYSQLTILSESMASQESLSSSIKDLQSVIDAIEHYFIRPLEDLDQMVIIPLSQLKESFAIFRQQLEQIMNGNLTCIPSLQPGILMMIMAAKLSFDHYANRLRKYLQPKLEELDSTTIEHERMLYLINTPGLDILFQLVLNHSSFFRLAEHQMYFKRVHTSDYIYQLGESEATISRERPTRSELPVKLRFPSQIKPWFRSADTVTFFDENKLAFVQIEEQQHKIALLDLAAVWTSMNIEYVDAESEPDYWVLPPVLQINQPKDFSNCPGPLIVLENYLLRPVVVHVQTEDIENPFVLGRPVNTVPRLRIYAWSSSSDEQPVKKEWNFEEFDCGCTNREPAISGEVIKRKKDHLIFVAVNEDTHWYRILVFSKGKECSEHKLLFTQMLKVLTPDATNKVAITWICTKGKIFILAATFDLDHSSLHYLHHDQFVRIGSNSSHAPGFRRFSDLQGGRVSISAIRRREYAFRLKRTIRIPSSNLGYERMMITSVKLRF